MGKHFSVTDFPHLMVDNNVTPHPLEDYIINHPMPISVKAQNNESFFREKRKMVDKKNFSIDDIPGVDNNITPHPLEEYIISHPLQLSPDVLSGKSFINVSSSDTSDQSDQ